ncbi:PREDICTED: golgin subfamily A member 6-like protein 22 [Trachymyrmex cornetzi]|uniref:golgin subfamily A member 6-like protein 22 n=1 Tax=Trachymyrmex cornetzi TaxID=471704 RepID=UPI00084F1093|nr:PREDICTED: golgin subfamily A member 6-like protein 22 [Trachymyrmex cornetzi]
MVGSMEKENIIIGGDFNIRTGELDSIEWEEEEITRREELRQVIGKELGALVKKKVKIRRRELGYKDWWNRSCTRKKREMQRVYKKWRSGKVGRGVYMEEKRKFKELKEKRQKERREEEEAELSLKREADIWKVINKKTGKKIWRENIEKEEWRKHFMSLLGGTEERTQEEEGRAESVGENRGEEQEIEELKEEEMKEALKKMKNKKAKGIDEIPAETWKYAGGTLWNDMVDLMRQIWKQGEIPEDWKKSIIVPLYKRGDTEKVRNYRGISLLCTAYKWYAEILRTKLEKEVKRNNVIPETQTGFRKGRSTMDNTYIYTESSDSKEQVNRKEGEENIRPLRRPESSIRQGR